MAKKKWLHKILAILPSISLIVILLISSFEIGAYGDWNFYEKEYEKYKVADELYMEMPDIMKVTKFMMSYLRGNEKKLSIETEVEGNIQDFFNEKDRLHMADVQGLFLGGLAIRRGAIIVLLFSMAALVLMKADWKRLIPQMYQRVLAVFLALTAVAGFLFSRDFNKYFVIFHHIFFNNNLWILDPAEDYMIRMLPEGYGKIQHLIQENGAETFTGYLPATEKEKQENLQGLQDTIARVFPGAKLVSWTGSWAW